MRRIEAHDGSVKHRTKSMAGTCRWRITIAQHKQNKNHSNLPRLGEIKNTSIKGLIDKQEVSVVK